MSLFGKKKKEIAYSPSIDNKSGLKFRIKEYITFFGNKETHKFFPQICVESIESGYKVNYQNTDYDKECSSEYHNWGYLTRNGFDTIEEAKEYCSGVKSIKDKIEIKYHDL